MADPLAGQRDAINRGDRKHLAWRDEGKGWPVEEGQVFELRDCAIEITRRRRVKQKDGFWFIAEFARYGKRGDKVRLLAKGGGDGHGYTDNDRQALKSGEKAPNGEQDEGDVMLTLLGPTPEPEAIPRDEVKHLSGSQQAQARYQGEVQRERSEFAALPPGEQLERLRELAAVQHVDISSDVRVIEQRLEKIRGKVMRKEMEAA